MDARVLARGLAASRIVFGAGLISSPERLTVPWIGREGAHAGGRVLGRALGARDLVLGAGVIAAGDEQLPMWIIASAVADGTDLVATVTGGRALPLTGRVLVGAMAAFAVVAGIVSLAGLKH